MEFARSWKPRWAHRLAGAVCIAALLPSSLAHAQDALAPAQVQSIEAQLRAGLAAVNAQNLAATKRAEILRETLSAVAHSNAGIGPAAITFVATSAIAFGVPADIAIHGALLGGVMGGAAALPVTHALIAAALQARAPAGAVGAGLGLAAAGIANINAISAQQVALAVANDGTRVIQTGFVAGIVQAGGSDSLASIASGDPNAAANMRRRN